MTAPNEQAVANLVEWVQARDKVVAQRMWQQCLDAAVEAAGKSPTLGQQRMIRALREVQP